MIDQVPRTLDASQESCLRALSRLVIALLEDHKSRLETLRRETEQSRARLGYMLAITASGKELKAYIDRDYTWRYVNQAYLDYWCVERDHFEGKHLADVLGQRIFLDHIKPRLDLALQGDYVDYEATFDFPGNQRSPHSQHSRPATPSPAWA